MDTFPYESWADAQAAAGAEGYFTLGPGDNAATIALVAIAFVLMIFVFVWWIRLEDRKLRGQADRIRSISPTTEGV